MEIPADLRYSKEHEWARLEGETATIGITDFAQDQLGDIVYLNLPAVGTVVDQFAKAGEIESVKSVSDLFVPVGGAVTEINQAAVDNPELVNKSPYGDGWLLKLTIADRGQFDALMTPDEYRAATES